jgi:hypothetical protein
VKASELSPLEFQTAVRMHLTKAIENIPSTVPQDIVTDPAADKMMRHLNALDELLYGLGAEERDKEDAERKRTLRVEAKRQIPELEELAMSIDRRVQHAMAVLGSEARDVISPMDADLCVSAFVRFLDAFPDRAFAMGRPIPPDFPSSYDITVASIIAAMRIRKDHAR